MPQHKIVSQSEWTAQRKALLAREKEFTRARDRLSAERRALPWVKVEKPYVFDTPAGKKTLDELFDGRSQLIVYHFMLGPGWVGGCPNCSYLADHFDGAIVHLSHRDATFVVVSRAPLAEIEAYKKRMGWRWVLVRQRRANTTMKRKRSAATRCQGPVFSTRIPTTAACSTPTGLRARASTY